MKEGACRVEKRGRRRLMFHSTARQAHVGNSLKFLSYLQRLSSSIRVVL